MKRLHIPGTNLSVISFDIIGKSGRVIKPGARDCFQYRHTDGSRGCSNRWKLIWCAEHNVDPRQVPKNYSFRELNGVIMCETLSDRMHNTYIARRENTHVKWEDYDFIEQYAKTCKEYLEGNVNARLRIFLLLNSRRNELIQYAMHSAGGVGKENATYYADQAIFYTFTKTIEGQYHVPSPMASMKWKVNRLIKENRKRNYE